MIVEQTSIQETHECSVSVETQFVAEEESGIFDQTFDQTFN